VRISTIPPGIAFLDALAKGLLARIADPLALADMQILLPTRRAARALSESFLRHGKGAAMLLPRMVPLGDVDAAELDLGAAADLGLAESLDLAPAIEEPRRQLLLTRLILQQSEERTPDHAARLAHELARLLDQVHTEGLSFAALPSLVPADLAEHWQITIRFLEIVSKTWPQILASEGMLDPADRRRRLMELQAEAWRRAPPSTPVVVAGSTGSIRATADLMKVVAGLPAGELVLPGLDRDADEKTWTAIGEEPTHPQHTLFRLLAHLEVSRAQVTTWPAGPEPEPRTAFLQHALKPAATTEDWYLEAPPAAAIERLARLDLPTAEAEARAIALVLREALEEPERRAMLVTPDRSLGRRVAAEMARWDIAVDDSGGQPLASTPPGTFLRLLLTAAETELAPVALLALLKHPLASGGREPQRFREYARALERAVLRGPRPRPGIEGLAQALESVTDREERSYLLAFVRDLGRRLAPLTDPLTSGSIALAELLDGHIAAAEALAATESSSGAERLWQGEAGEALAGALAEIGESAGIFPPLAGASYPALYQALTDGLVVRRQRGQHPRLSILGPLEARLQTADVVVLGGLNEGTWPADPAADPWLSRPMRTSFGLPSSERRIGLSAHDFVELAAARHVVLTRAERVEGTPTVASRWLLRLDVVLGEENAQALRARGADLRAWVDALDRSDGPVRPTAPPAPTPPAEARPKELAVTDIETLMRDPYALYARRILKLRRLDEVDADPGAADRGKFIHAALDRFVATYPGALPEFAFAKLIDIGRQAFGAALENPGVETFWWPRFERIARWFLDQEAERRPTLAASATEAKGRIEIDGFTLRAVADRIDRLKAGGLVILDYKTGLVPKNDHVELGLSPQLPLEALIAERGRFERVDRDEVERLEYWRLSGGDPPGSIRPASKSELRALIAAAEAGLRRVIREFADPRTPYRSRPDPEAGLAYSDYDHLARVQEWSSVR
jgi:ATP-dependent helicase/nuclease subunit B